jgi:predicted type IV restriction endonuclease
MDFIDRIRELATRIPKQLEYIQTEEATKNALVMPFIGVLGYNVFDPTEVTPELNADVGIKKGEKVDYAILKDGKPIILFECKWHKTNLDNIHPTQLYRYRYFSVTECRIAVLTNGIVYRFFSDLEEPNKLDQKPFLEFNMLDVQESLVAELKKLSKDAFNLEEMISSAADLKYTREIKRILTSELNSPSDKLVHFFGTQVTTGK